MASKRIKFNRRNAATVRGLHRRIEDADFDKVDDARQSAKVRFGLSALLGLCTLAFASGALALRGVEARSEQLFGKARRLLGLPDERVADNTLAAIFPNVDPEQARRALHRQVKAEHRRGNLEPISLSSGLSVVAIDGKVLSTLRWRDLVSVTRHVLASEGDERAKQEGWEPSEDEVRVVFALRFAHVQLVKPKNEPMHGLVRLHRSTLVSSDAAVCVDQRPIPGATNEVGAIEDAVRDLLRTYGRTKLFDVVTADAGNTSLALASLLHEHGKHYFLAIKSPQGEIHAEALRTLNVTFKPQADASASEERGGKTITYELRRTELPEGFLSWKHARQLVVVERTEWSDDEPPKVGRRYFVSSLGANTLPAADALKLCRMHWRCENEGHWTSDAVLLEDARRAVGSRHPVGMLVVSVLRMIAQNILAVLRALSRMGPKRRKPTWRQVVEHTLVALFVPLLESSRFDAVEA